MNQQQMHNHCGRMRRLATAVVALAMLTCAAGEIIQVGGNSGWMPYVNYTQWAANLGRFNVGDWLYFVFDEHYYNVLEVSRSNYEQCNDDEFIRNITRSGGRSLYKLKTPRTYYFLSSGGYCFQGMRLSIHATLPSKKNHY